MGNRTTERICLISCVGKISQTVISSFHGVKVSHPVITKSQGREQSASALQVYFCPLTPPEAKSSMRPGEHINKDIRAKHDEMLKPSASRKCMFLFFTSILLTGEAQTVATKYIGFT